MTQEKAAGGEAEKIVEKKRQKAQQQHPQAMQGRPLTPQEKAFVDQWCLGMRGVDQAMFILQLHEVVHNMAQRLTAQDKKASGIVAPDGSKL